MSDIIALVTPFVEQYGVIGLFFLSLVEEIAVPIPSSLPLLAAGFFSLSAHTSFLSAFLPAIVKVGIPGALGLTIGGIFGYALAYFGGEFAIRKWGRWFGVSWNSVEKFQKKLNGEITDEILIIMLRATPFFPNIAVSLACGLIHYPMKKFLITSLLGTFLRSLIMGLLGWYLGASYLEYASTFEYLGRYIVEIIGGALLIGGIYLILRKKRKKHSV